MKTRPSKSLRRHCAACRRRWPIVLNYDSPAPSLRHSSIRISSIPNYSHMPTTSLRTHKQVGATAYSNDQRPTRIYSTRRPRPSIGRSEAAWRTRTGKAMISSSQTRFAFTSSPARSKWPFGSEAVKKIRNSASTRFRRRCPRALMVAMVCGSRNSTRRAGTRWSNTERWFSESKPHRLSQSSRRAL
jgi:hypothetical protein